MYEIKRDELTRKNFFAGDFPIAKEVGEVADGETVRQYAPVIKTADGFKEAPQGWLTCTESPRTIPPTAALSVC